jgi:hypothetical protein
MPVHEFLWIGMGTSLVAALMVMAVILSKHHSRDLGSVSARWIAEHRSQEP